jgi:hypothetical protein
VSTLKR